jgi:DNA-binding transcriptional LysR family regulator
VQFHSTAVNLVEAGVGCAVLPWSVLGANDRPHIKRIRLGGPTVRRRVMLLTSRKTSLSPPAKAFVDLVTSLFEERGRTIRDAL